MQEGEGDDEVPSSEWTIGDDCALADRDVVAGFLEMGVLERLRFFLQSGVDAVIQQSLDVLLAISLHSAQASTWIVKVSLF